MTRDELIAILRECLPERTTALAPDDDLLDSGAVDSLTFVDFITAVETRLDLSLPDEIVFGDRFNTLSRIAESILALKGHARS